MLLSLNIKMEPKQVIRDTANGKLRGTFQQSYLEYEYYAFKGIPYAKPPIRELRFQPPQPIEPWTDIRDALSHGPISAQYDHGAKKVIGSEDCLYLNVYTRSLESNANAPVMFWIHGGGFLYGSGNDDMFGPDFLLTKNVVLVTVNYRLGVFGFLNLHNKVASGNQGLKDLVMALKWLKSHLAHFGGDPNNVTIFGGSSGAASVHYLAMSPMAKGLFHKAICQSGTALSPLLMTKEPDQQKLFKFIESLGCKDKDPERILDFMRKIDAEKLIQTQESTNTPLSILQASFLFTPTVDDKFMPMTSIEAAKQGIQVPLMIGWNEMEALFALPIIKAIDLKDIDRNLENFMSPRHKDMLKSHGLTLKDLRYLYFKNEPISKKNVSSLLEFFGDVALIYFIHQLVKIQVHNGSASTYLYRLSFDKNLSLSKMQMKTTMRGANHGDELMYLFRAKVCDALNFDQLQKHTASHRVMKQMVELWTNFAKTGRPTLEMSDLLPLHWLPVASDVVLRYFNIDEELRMEKILNLDQRYSHEGNVAQFR